ncbi:DUF2922 domain-containing protein [Aminithiophilus ramosus]|uniref:DUF2922 domain-containing protein n=2 Tax=Synergistales TaxID=649776 RepID=A0A9Q7EVE2_9BACT|nr:DUF2922 domain-containing protein [Aminithiophilus ramosus]QTX31914.1 DUF2922 domain-containing protein [Aminithiophilus ramosus]QVL35759.1 DUF2922 domain-containing protein [Synergistota bacterium]
MATTLRLHFEDTMGEKVTLSLANVRGDLTAQEVQTAMDALVATPVFGYGPAAVLGADLVDRTVTELIAG